MAYRNIVVGTDGSATAERAVAQAAALAATDGARLVIVMAYSPGTDNDARIGVPPDDVPADIRHVLTERAQAEELTASGRATAREAGVRSTVVQVLQGDPAETLLDAARDFDADLIVVGSKGLASHAHFILGSVAASVAHHAPCDVLVAHTTG